MPVLMYAESKAKEAGKLEGKLEGRQEALLSAVCQLLTARFGELNNALQAKLQKLPAERLAALFTAALKFQSETELTTWLKQSAPGAAEPAQLKRRNATRQ